MYAIDYIDSHTAGEPTRVVVAGFPELGSGSAAERRVRFAKEHDRLRSAIVCEPRGSDVLVGALLLPPQDPDACAAVIFFNNVGYLGMCGHGAIGVVRTLVELGRITAGRHRLETPVGDVEVELGPQGQVSIDNVESYRSHAGVVLEVPGYGRVEGDVAWGGNWFFITREAPSALEVGEHQRLSAFAEALRLALQREGICGDNGAEIDHIEIDGSAPDGSGARNFVLCPGLAYDRSPCGTGTSAKLACLAAEGKLAEGQVWHQQGILGTVFEASYRRGQRGILPRISGRAFLTARGRLLIEAEDPFAWGIRADLTSGAVSGD
jgi:4-hydroxyproline epimerase